VVCYPKVHGANESLDTAPDMPRYICWTTGMSFAHGKQLTTLRIGAHNLIVETGQDGGSDPQSLVMSECVLCVHDKVLRMKRMFYLSAVLTNKSGSNMGASCSHAQQVLCI